MLPKIRNNMQTLFSKNTTKSSLKKFFSLNVNKSDIFMCHNVKEKKLRDKPKGEMVDFKNELNSIVNKS